MSDRLDPEAFAQQLNIQKQNTMIEAHGTALKWERLISQSTLRKTIS